MSLELHENTWILLRTANIERLAEMVWPNRRDAHLFLNSPSLLLGDKTPLEIAAKSAEGYEKISRLLAAIEYGVPL